MCYAVLLASDPDADYARVATCSARARLPSLLDGDDGHATLSYRRRAVKDGHRCRDIMAVLTDELRCISARLPKPREKWKKGARACGGLGNRMCATRPDQAASRERSRIRATPAREEAAPCGSLGPPIASRVRASTLLLAEHPPSPKGRKCLERQPNGALDLLARTAFRCAKVVPRRFCQSSE